MGLDLRVKPPRVNICWVTPFPGGFEMCALIKKELGFPLEAEREEDWENVVGPNVLTLLLYAISDKLNFVLEMSALSFICAFICFLPHLF